MLSYEEYTPFGSAAYQAVASQLQTPKRYRFAGKERDEESGLYYQRARYYAPWLGRWTSADPAGTIDGPNLYRYVRNNPVALTDPSGTQPALPEDKNTQFGRGPFKSSIPPPSPANDPLPIDFGDGLSGAVWIESPKPAPKPKPNPKSEGRWGWFKRNVISRALGVAKVGAGAAGFVVGAALCETGLGCVVGAPLMIASADVAASGGVQAVAGDPAPTAAGVVFGPKVQEIEELTVNAAGLALPFATGPKATTVPGIAPHLTKAEAKAAQAVLAEEASSTPRLAASTKSRVSSSAARSTSSQGNVSQATRKLQRRQSDPDATGTFAGIKPADADALVSEILANADLTIHGTISISGGVVRGISGNVVGTPGFITFSGNRGVLYTDTGEFITFIDKLRPWPLRKN